MNFDKKPVYTPLQESNSANKKEKELKTRLDKMSNQCFLDEFLEDFDIEARHGKVSVDEIKMVVKKLADVLRTENLPESRWNDYFYNTNFLHKNFADYQDLILGKIDLGNAKNYNEATKYLEFILKLSDNTETRTGNPSEKFAEIIKKLEKEINNKETSYFINLYIQNILEILKAQKRWTAEDDYKLYENYERKIKKEFGDDWENHVEEYIDEDEIKEEKEFFIKQEFKLPFQIAPKIFALPKGNVFFISKEGDFEKIKNLIFEFKKFIESQNNFSGDVVDVYDEMKELADKIYSYCNKELKLEDLEIYRKEKDDDIKERNRQNYYDFRYLHNDFIREKIKEELGVVLEELELKEQFYFLQFIKNKKFAEIKKIKKFIQKYGKNGLKTFLSLEFSDEMGEKILNIGEGLDEADAGLIFLRYAKIVKSVEDFKKEFFKKINNPVVDDDDVQNISEEILKKANCLLVNFAKKIESGEEINRQKLIEELKNYRTDFLIALSIYKAMKDKIDVEDIDGVEYGEKEASQISEKELKEKLKIYKDRFKKYPKLQKKVLEGFERKIKEGKSKTKIYDYKYRGKEMAFLRIDDLGDGKKYFGSFNSVPSAKGHAIGLALLKKVFTKINEGEVIEGDCIPVEPISFKYVESFGFVVTHVEENYAGSGMDLFHIERKQENSNFEYRDERFDLDKIKQEFENNQNNPKNPDAEKFILKFNQGDENIVKVVNKYTKENFIMTRYILDRDNRDVYCCFEKNKHKFSGKFMK